MPTIRMTRKRSALLEYLRTTPDATSADLRRAGFGAWIVARLAELRWLTWDPRVGAYRLTRSGKAMARRSRYSLAA